MSDTPNNPVTQQPKRMSRTAHFGIMAAMAAMAGGFSGGGTARQGRRNGKHHGQNKGAFGKQR